MAKSVRTSSGTVVKMPASRANRASKRQEFPAHEQIALRAFELYCQRGGWHGHDIEDWLQAERELQSGTTHALGLTIAG